MLDLSKYIFLEDQYVIIRMNENFPKYKHRSDLDIVCLNTKEFAKKIKSRWDQKENLKEHFPNGHHHLDYFNENGLNFKFDLIDNFNYFKKLSISKEFIIELIKNYIIVKKSNHNWKVPNQDYETVIRYIEWYEHPNKQKHKIYYDKHKNDHVDFLLKKHIRGII